MTETDLRPQSTHGPANTSTDNNSHELSLDGTLATFAPPTPPPDHRPLRHVTPSEHLARVARPDQQEVHEASRTFAPKLDDRRKRDGEEIKALDTLGGLMSHSTFENVTHPRNAIKTQIPRCLVDGRIDERALLVGPNSYHGKDIDLEPAIPTNNKRKQSQADPTAHSQAEKEKVLKLSPEGIHKLVSSPESIPLRVITSNDVRRIDDAFVSRLPTDVQVGNDEGYITSMQHSPQDRHSKLTADTNSTALESANVTLRTQNQNVSKHASALLRPSFPPRALSSPMTNRRSLSPRRSANLTSSHAGEPQDSYDPAHIHHSRATKSPTREYALPSPKPQSFPLPPLSIPTYLQLELSSHRPSQLYIHRSITSDFPYESSRVKIERLLNFLFLPPQLEGVLWFGTLACLDAWLYTFTILPLRLLKSFYILCQSWSGNLAAEVGYVSHFVYRGTGRMWQRRRTRAASAPRQPGVDKSSINTSNDTKAREQSQHVRNHHRAKAVPSLLLPDDKADILRGCLIICTCLILLRLDASRMYHWIRGQAAIKLYVIYNVLEVCDRLFSAIGQDVLECLFSRESLERKPDGHSKILRPFWLFLLALTYTSIHATALFSQVITLNVAVNSYSNALITLLMSNQFVEIKSTVFKKFEKENLFQLTCADVVERFQLWLMLTIIASRNIVETGGFGIDFATISLSSAPPSALSSTNDSNPVAQTGPLRASSSIIPLSFTLIPDLLTSLAAYAPNITPVLGPFLVVLGSEILVDWVKHAYISKFNNTRPAIYGRFLDVLAKDYYSNAFADQNLTKRLGLPVIPLSCLFIRASVQTYHMFKAAWMPSPIPSSSTTLASIHEQYTAGRASMPTSRVTALSHRFDDLLRQVPVIISSSRLYTNFTTILIFLLIFLVLLACKLVLGMLLLSFARSRYRTMKEREKASVHQGDGGKRVGGWGVVEVDDDKRRWIYEDDAAGLKAMQERADKDKSKRDRGASESFDKVKRYEMVAKRIW